LILEESNSSPNFDRNAEGVRYSPGQRPGKEHDQSRTLKEFAIEPLDSIDPGLRTVTVVSRTPSEFAGVLGGLSITRALPWAVIGERLRRIKAQLIMMSQGTVMP
jgi:hypothetical protein